MKLQDINSENSTNTNPCDLTSKFLMHEQDGGTMRTFVEQFECQTEEDIAKTARSIIRTICMDRYMRKKHLAEDDPMAASVFVRYNKVWTDANKIDRFPASLAGEIWHGGYSRRLLEARTEKLLKVAPDAARYEAAAARIKSVYSLTDSDIKKIHFFVEQTRAGERFPNSMRRVLYLWGKAKWTGKTTCGRIITSILNGYKTADEVDQFSSTLSREMQVKSFVTPKIAEWHAVLLDEMFYADMSKTYSDFKRFITSSNGVARLPFGQEFRWEGYPNYVATSNDPLQKFIKDWDDRRYLAVEFRQAPTERMTDAEIASMWYDFVAYGARVENWKDALEELQDEATEKGDRTEVAEELEVEMRRLEFLRHILSLTSAGRSPANPQNHISLKTIVDWFSASLGSTEAHKRRGEVEQAFVKVFGKRYSTTNYWLLYEIQDRARELEAIINDPTGRTSDDDGLPF